MRAFLAASVLVLALAGTALGQAAIQQVAADLNAGTNVCAQNQANVTDAQDTCDVAVGIGQFAYITAISIDVCGDATGTEADNVAFTSTNINGSLSWMFSMPASGYQCQRVTEHLATPLKSATAGIDVTIVSPAAEAHNAFNIRAYYYLANQ